MGDLSHQLRRALARAGDGKALSVDETEALLSARGERLLDLLGIAARLRELGHGTTVTYSRKVFIPLTMLCRDHCHYCTFAKPPARLDAPFLSPEEVVAIADAGRKLGCKEALFTLGDRPEDRYPEARAWLEERGYRSTLDYVRAMAITVIEETGLLPHLNPGVMSYEELARLKHVSASMGLMLETSSDRLSRKGGPHFGSPDKVPAVRLRTIEDAGRLAIPFTTGVLVGIAYNSVHPFIGVQMGIKGLVVMMLGGLGNVPGAVLGGLLLGILEVLGAGYLASSYRDAFAFGALVLILLVRPEGLLGLRTQRRD